MQGFGIGDLAKQTPEIEDVLVIDMLAREYGWTAREIFETDPDLVEALCLVISERTRLMNKELQRWQKS